MKLSLAWLLAQDDAIVPIPGTKRRSYLEENAGAAGLSLAADVVARLDGIFAPGRVAGERYGLAWQRSTDVED